MHPKNTDQSAASNGSKPPLSQPQSDEQHANLQFIEAVRSIVDLQRIMIGMIDYPAEVAEIAKQLKLTADLAKQRITMSKNAK